MTSLLWNAQTAKARAAAAERAVAATPARQLCSRLGGSEARALAYGSPCGGFESRPRMKLLLVLLPLLFGFDPTYSAPSCRDTSNHLYDEREYTCFSFSKAEDFQQYVPKDLNFPRLRFVLKECLLDHVPGAALAGIPALSLDFDNCKAKSFSLSTAAESNPFHGLEETVSRMGFMHNSSIPESWSLLKDLSRLKELAFYQMAGLDLTPDFNSLPQSVRRVLIFRSTYRKGERTLVGVDAQPRRSLDPGE
ncbi:hypothetical protein HPB47_004437 [Ixodes persulcatus]|uniref:Uncharacterized protein n=1 Tax=Ixodes persulcatus TaxID=34615 RepID=A0AC60PGW6_IXOPE|nr:hypothetical protein HPB47_004437 [Ixodes persulcatus]